MYAVELEDVLHAKKKAMENCELPVIINILNYMSRVQTRAGKPKNFSDTH